MATNVKENGFNIFFIVPDVYSFNEYLFKYLKIQFKKITKQQNLYLFINF